MESLREKGGQKKIFEEVIAEILPNLMKTINPQIQDTQQTPHIRNMKKTTSGEIITKFCKTRKNRKTLSNQKIKDLLLMKE